MIFMMNYDRGIVFAFPFPSQGRGVRRTEWVCIHLRQSV